MGNVRVKLDPEKINDTKKVYAYAVLHDLLANVLRD